MDFIDVTKLVELKRNFDNALKDYQNSFKLYAVNISFDGIIARAFSKSDTIFDCFRKTYSDYCYDQVIYCIREIEYFNIDMTKEREQVSAMFHLLKEKTDV